MADPLSLALMGAGFGANIFGAFQQSSRLKQAMAQRRAAIERFKNLGSVIGDRVRGADIVEGDRRAVSAFDERLARISNQNFARLADRGLRGGALAQFVRDRERQRGHSVGNLESSLESTRPARIAERQREMIRYQRELAQLENAQANAQAQQPNALGRLGGGMLSAGTTLAGLDALRQTYARAGGSRAPRASANGGFTTADVNTLLSQYDAPASGAGADVALDAFEIPKMAGEFGLLPRGAGGRRNLDILGFPVPSAHPYGFVPMP